MNFIKLTTLFYVRLHSVQRTVWQQIYDPFGSMTMSTLMGAVLVLVMLIGIGFLHMKAHIAAGAGLFTFAVFDFQLHRTEADQCDCFDGDAS